MGVSEVVTLYEKIVRSAKKDKYALPCLDDILAEDGVTTAGEIKIGVMDIPLDMVVGTRTAARGQAFNSSFMPIMDKSSEFGQKWIALYAAHEEEGIRDAVKVYEYKHKFYAEEGNKRVSVLKAAFADDIVADVSRIMPPRIPENAVYFEFVDFFRLSGCYDFEFSASGSYALFQQLLGKRPDELWEIEDRANVRTLFTRFSAIYKEEEEDHNHVRLCDSFLGFLKLFDYKDLLTMSITQLKGLVVRSMGDMMVSQAPTLKLEPSDISDKKTNIIIGTIFKDLKPKPLKVSFINEKSASTSAWSYGHELGRTHLEEVFPELVTTSKYDFATPENINGLLHAAIDAKNDVIFTTSPTLLNPSLQAAIEHEALILNCSLNTSHKAIRTYYARMYEAKFLMGAVAGALSQHNRVGYVADYPIFGMTANINAFALGAKMVNPRVKVFLEWSTMKGIDIDKEFEDNDISVISGQDFIIPMKPQKKFGLYRTYDNGDIENLAMPVWNWGRMYEAILRQIWNGSYQKEDSGSDKGVNYWWGMSADVIDVAVSRHLPIGTKRLVNLLKETIRKGDFNPFSGVLYSQDGVISGKDDDVLRPEDIVSMDWLAENVVGRIPSMDELVEGATAVVNQSGITPTAPGGY